MPIIVSSKPGTRTIQSVIAAASDDAIDAAAQRIRGGELIAFPTETVYGLGADALNGSAVARIFAAKGRPQFNPLIVHVATREAAQAYGTFCDSALRLAAAFWPGPLTLVVPRKPECGISDLVSAGLPTLALRVPSHAVAQRLLAACGRPLAAPSANRSGHVSATLAAHVASDLGPRVAMVLDGGPAQLGLESTIVSCVQAQPLLLRPGAIAHAALEAVAGAPILRRSDAPGALTAPGQLASHYAPRAALRLNATRVAADEALLAFGPNVPVGAIETVNLSPRGDLIEAAANLFASLRALDGSGAGTIAVMPVPDEGLGEAINDRLRRAAAPRC